MTKISECEDCKAKLIGYSLAVRTCDACEAKRWNKVGAQRTVEDILQSQAKATTMLWIGTEPCYRAETNAHITAFFQRNACRLIERVAAERGIDLQAEMRKSEAVERTLAELRARA